MLLSCQVRHNTCSRTLRLDKYMHMLDESIFASIRSLTVDTQSPAKGEVSDQVSLDSFTKGKKPFVNLIMRKWPYSSDQQANDDGNEEEGDNDEGCEPLDGSTDEDVGSCQVGVSHLVPSAYSELCHPNAWYTFCRRPPAVV